MTSARQLRALIAADPQTAHLARKPIVHAIAEVRKIRAHNKEYYRLIARSHEGEDEAYDKGRN